VTAGSRALALLAVAGLAAGSCGEDEETATVDPATVAPPDAPLYIEVTVRPQDDQAEAAEDALSKLLDTDDPGGFIAGALEGEFAEESDTDVGLTYEEDVEPWLGERAGIFFEEVADEDSSGAFAVATTDPAAAREAMDKAAEADDVEEHDASYAGVEYRADDDGNAYGIVGDFAVAGTEEGFKAAVDASTGEALSDAEEFRDEAALAPEERMGFMYADPPALLEAAERTGELNARQQAGLEILFGDALGAPISAWASVEPDRVSVDVSTVAGEDAPEESPLLRELPADAWYAQARTSTSEELTDYLEAVEGAGVPGVGAGDLSAQLERELGVRLEDLEWIGDAAAYVKGTSLLGLGGAVIAETTDERASARALDRLRIRLEVEPDLEVEPIPDGFSVVPAGTPIAFHFVQREGRVVAGLGELSVDDAFAPEQTLGDSETFGAALDALGGDAAVGLFVDFETGFELIDGLAGLEPDPGYEQARPYLENLDYVIAGTRREGDRDIHSLAVGLREAPSEPATAAIAP
jgi:Protein of unknown function (DUF3352)